MVANLKRRKLARRDAWRKIIDNGNMRNDVLAKLDSDYTHMDRRGEVIDQVESEELDKKETRDIWNKKEKRNLNSEAWQRSSLCREVRSIGILNKLDYKLHLEIRRLDILMY